MDSVLKLKEKVAFLGKKLYPQKTYSEREQTIAEHFFYHFKERFNKNHL